MITAAIISIVIMLAAAVVVVMANSFLAAVAAVSVVSLAMSVLFALLHAPDVAMAEAAVGAGLSGVLLALAGRRLGLTGPGARNDGAQARAQAWPVADAGLGAARGGGRRIASLVFLAGLGVLLAAILASLPFGGSPMQVGQAIVDRASGEVGAANIVTSIVLAYRGFDTLGEVTILFVAATAAGLVLSGAGRTGSQQWEKEPSGFIIERASRLLLPFLLVLGAYIAVHGHLTPGGGFQGGAILAAAFIVPLLASPGGTFNHAAATVIEGFAGVSFVIIGLISLLGGEAFLTPLLGKGTLGALFSAGSLPLLYIAIGLKVGSELAGLLHRVLADGGRP